MIRIEVLHEYECHAGIGRRIVQEGLESLKPAGGGANSDNEFSLALLVRPRRKLPR